MPSWRSANPIFPGSRACLSAYSRGHFGERRRPKNISHFDARGNTAIQPIQETQETQMTQTSLEIHQVRRQHENR